MDVHLTAILESSKSVADLDFSSHSQIFVNAVLNTDDIVHLIRDAETHEQSLFTSVDAEGVPQRQSLVPPTPFKAATSTGPAAQDISVLLNALSRLIDIYPMPRAQEHLDDIILRHDQIKSSITDLESTIEKQRREYHVLIQQNKENAAPTSQQHFDPVTIPEQIKREEMEIVALEAMMADKQEKRDALDRELEKRNTSDHVDSNKDKEMDQLEARVNELEQQASHR